MIYLPQSFYYLWYNLNLSYYMLMDTKKLIRYIKGGASEIEKTKIIDWIESDPKNMKEFMALRKLYDITLWNNADDNLKHRVNIPFMKNAGIAILKYAAVFTLAFFIVSILSTDVDEKELFSSIEIPVGQHAHLKLSDGSKVWLNSHSKFEFQECFSGNTRKVKLEGEGYFEVAKDLERPFIVELNGYEIKVLGTTFNVNTYPGSGQTTVSLIEGAVELIKGDGQKLFTLKTNDEAIINQNGVELRQIQNPDQFLWRKGLIVFKNTPFDEIVKTLEQAFDVTLKVEKKEIMDVEFTGKFRRTDGVSHVLKVLSISNEFEFDVDKEQNIIIIE